MTGRGERLPLLDTPHSWEDFLSWGPSSALPAILREYLPRCRWFGDKSRQIDEVRIESVLPLDVGNNSPVFLCILSVTFLEGVARRYFLPLGLGAEAQSGPAGPVARIPSVDQAVVVDALFLPETGNGLLDLFFPETTVRQKSGRCRRRSCPVSWPPVLWRALPALSGESRATRPFFSVDP